MFKFGFISDQSERDKCSVVSLENKDESSLKLHWVASKEISNDDIKITENDKIEANVVNIGEEKLLHVKPSQIIQNIKQTNVKTDNIIFLAEESHSDLIPSKYEGGLKIWECTHDIANYLDESYTSGKAVLDLGCGVGLLGILALKLGALSVHFQDYNEEVVRHATLPNVHLNAVSHQMTRCKFFSGDWESFADLTQSTYDLILTSETIYNPDNYLKLHDAIQRLLKPNGVVLMGAKSYYFGVGGSTNLFKKLVQEKDVFQVELVWKCSEGVQREILKLTFKNSKT